MPDLALADLVLPYVLKGDSYGQWHAAISVLSVREHAMAVDETGVVISGTARFGGGSRPWFDWRSMSFGIDAENTEGHPAKDVSRREPWLDIHDTEVEFELLAPRAASQKVQQAVAAIGGAGDFAAAAAVLTALDAGPSLTAASDYPSTTFTLDILLKTAMLRLPFLRPARLDPSGILVEDTATKNVEITLPGIRLRLQQGSSAADPLVATVLSLGASSLDEQASLGVADLLTMRPPYAFIGPSRVIGIGFRSAVLDLSDGVTPPSVLAQFGYDDSWTGVYLPELRIYVAPEGVSGLAVDVGATNLLIGTGASAGVTGDFELAVIDQGGGDLRVSARFYDAVGQCFSIVKSSNAAATVTIPDHTRMVVDIDGGLTPYTASARIGGGPDSPGRLFGDVSFGGATTLTIVVTARGSEPGAKTATLTVDATLKQATALPPPGSASPQSAPAATVRTDQVKRGTVPQQSPTLRIVSQDALRATLTLDGADPAGLAGAQWTAGGAAAGAGPTATVACAPGETVTVRAVLPGSAALAGGSSTGFYRFNHPNRRDDPDAAAYALAPGNVKASPAPDEGLSSAWIASDESAELAALLQGVPGGTAITIKGFASFEPDDDPAPHSTDWERNNSLAQNRAVGLEALISAAAAHLGKTFAFPATAADMTNWGPAQSGDVKQRANWWKAVATWTAATPVPETTVDGTVARPAAVPPVPAPIPDNPADAAPPAPPSWFTSADLKLRIVRDRLVALEIAGKFDIQTPTEAQLAAGGVPADQMPRWADVPNRNPADGIVSARLVVQRDDATGDVRQTLSFGADPADIDGLKSMGWLPPAPSDPPPEPPPGLSFLGLGVALWPLISTAADAADKGGGGVVTLALDGAAIVAATTFMGLKWLRAERFIWYGGEIDVQARQDGVEALLLVDVETAISAEIPSDTPLVSIDRKTPLTARYKAIGFILGNKPGESKFPFRPYFDSSKGYTLDVSGPGAIKVREPFDKILKILGARISRSNPTFVEIDLGFGADLGVVSIDRMRVRLNISPGGPPELSAFGASVNIPGVVQGRGYLEIGHEPRGTDEIAVIKGRIDITITPIKLRLAASLAIAQIPPGQGGPATGVMAAIEVDFPVAIPLANSGLGIYGLLGLFAMHFERDPSLVPAGAAASALAWLKATGGEVTDSRFWSPKINKWAFGVGAVLGTLGTDFILNMKGMLLLELPGPRLLLMMKANVISAKPDLHDGTSEGTFLAVIDLDFGRGTLTIGLAIDYKVKPLLEIQIPVEAFFNFHDATDWHLFVGTFDGYVDPDTGTQIGPVHATVLEVFDASGYLMLSGRGIPAHAELPAVTGLSAATGLHVSFHWGGDALYVEVGGGFDAVVGLSPFRLGGVLGIRGSLHLFIIDIGAWADLHVLAGEGDRGEDLSQIRGDVCGEVDFFFFSVSGCVGFNLSDATVPPPSPPALVKSLKIVSRSPALVAGSGTDRPIDAVIGTGPEGDTAPGDLPVVPIDAIPVLMMSAPPLTPQSPSPPLKFGSEEVGGTPQGPEGGWVKRGEVEFQYTLTAVELIGTPPTAGKTPATWWNTKAGDEALEAQLALLSWQPEPAPRALGSSRFLDEITKRKWGTVCQPAAPPAPLLWLFWGQPLGPSPTGCRLTGLPLPDPAGSTRSAPPDALLVVTERWRCGDMATDALRGIVPAEVEGAMVPCPGAPSPDSGPTPDFPPRPPVSVAREALPVSPSAAIRGGGAQALPSGPRPSLLEVVRRLGTGEPLTGAAHTGVLSGIGEPPATLAAARACPAWMLASPAMDTGVLIAFGEKTRGDAVAEAWKRLGFRPGPIDNAVVFRTGPIEYARLYLLVPLRLLPIGAVVIAVMQGDTVLSQRVVTSADEVRPGSLPPSWTAAASPWSPFVQELQEIDKQTEQYGAVLVEIRGAPGGDSIQVGSQPELRARVDGFRLRPFYVGAVEALRSAEVARSDYDTTEKTKLSGVVDAALNLDAADIALLQRGETYGVRATWTSATRSGGTETPGPQRQQTFWFRTDADPPAKLDPWILLALPGGGETHFFAAEQVRVVFSSRAVGPLYAAYGKKLQARLRPASFVEVPSTPEKPHPVPINASTLKNVAATLRTPWEDTLRRLAADPRSGLGCIPVTGTGLTHTRLEIAIPLDLFTDYLIDIEMLDVGQPDGAPGQRVWRSGFSTGGFQTLAAFALAMQVGEVRHRGVRTEDVGKLQAIGPRFAGGAPQGNQFDEELLKAGLDALPVPTQGGFTVFWDPGTPPQPAAILVDAPEPMWRTRKLPTEVIDPKDPVAKHWELLPQPWLGLEDASAFGQVEHIVAAPGGQRALVTLRPGARGRLLNLVLRRLARTEPYLADPAADEVVPVFSKTLAAAPWEEV
ncbi:hypothetical protein [Paracraurococcus lichenis]|uniref:Uncharacterized protein n=1 Tax=Paracraurococcus lichenis TaxID=3064888 RepID=A0ABT9E803_9PROT|nr:hypothetical protein [Paracraurococcus sp. LOR1-02]MDO9712259.1 hypothetical protein [Paracraurococcus sp. LOR1-02]